MQRRSGDAGGGLPALNHLGFTIRPRGRTGHNTPRAAGELRLRSSSNAGWISLLVVTVAIVIGLTVWPSIGQT